jgi:dipeptidyl aminopeptidase/acylaminoacyl peptidase
MKRFVIAISVLVLAFTAGANAQIGRFAVEDLLKVRRISDPQVAPDGRHVAFVVGDVNLDDNRVVNQIYLVPVGGGPAKQLTSGTSSAGSPRWSPDGKKIAFTTGGQIWVMDNDGDDKKQITKVSTGASGTVWSPDGNWIAFTSEVYPDCNDDECNRGKDEAAEKSKVKAHITERLLFRHWNEWRDVKRSHVFVVSTKGGNARDLTPGDFDSPPYAASSNVDFSFSPDGKELAFVKNPDKVEATSTNSDVYVIALSGGAPRNITARNRGYDATPVYTKDGRSIIYRSQATAGFEADRWRLMKYDRASATSAEIVRGFDQQVDEFVLAPDGDSIYFVAGERGHHPIFKVSISGGAAKQVVSDVFATNLNITADGRALVFAHSTLAAPPEIYRANINSGDFGPITSINRDLMARANLPAAEEMEWTGALGTKIHGFVVKPVDFDAGKKYPLVVLIHGGPQSAWNDSWSYRWNPQVFANNGYIVFSPNPRGSTGYGQKFVNDISGDWGGKVYTDLMNGVAEVLRRNRYIDRNRIGAAGASYGGYMVNWIEGHNNDPRAHFKVLVSHDGVYNLTSMYGGTEELWFPEWEFKGTPWTNKAMYERWSPHNFVANFKTPILVIHGELDYRVPIGEGLQLYTAVQRRGVESKLLIFPDEGHWVLKPQNSQLWHQTVLGWLDKYLKK